MQIATADYGFETRRHAEGTEFIVRPAPVAKWQRSFIHFTVVVLCGVASTVGVVVLALVLGLPGPVGLLLWLGAWIGGSWYGIRETRRWYDEHLRERHIQVSPRGVQVGETLYERAHIGALWLQSLIRPAPPASEDIAFVVGGAGASGFVAAGAATIATASMQASKSLASVLDLLFKPLRDRSWSLMMSYGSTPVMVAAMLNEHVANALRDKIVLALSEPGRPQD